MTIETRMLVGDEELCFTDLRTILGDRLPRLPHVLRLLAENHLRSTGDYANLLVALDDWLAGRQTEFEFTFRPNRLLMHDTTCTPALADIAGLRDAISEAGGDPTALTPQLPVEVSVDHSIAVDVYAKTGSAQQNAENEITRNYERYAFMKWASANMEGVHVNPPGTGIMHTINLEQLATVLEVSEEGRVHPDMLLGTDSHTPMINGIGVLGWGVGGLEAESVMFGQAASVATPKIVGVHLHGMLPPSVLVTDLALEITHLLRELGVTGDFVEFFGDGVSSLTADERAVIANMAPEYGATTGFFAVDAHTLEYLRRTGRDEKSIERIQPIFEEMGLWFDPKQSPHFDRQISIDLSKLKPTLAGPRRPQDRCSTAQIHERVENAIGRALNASDGVDVPDGAIAIAAITSCTNTSDPALLVAAALLAKKARSKGLSVPAWTKTSLAPGSPSTRNFLERAVLMDDLSALGFDIVGYGCTTCIGNSGPLVDEIINALTQKKAVCAITSGNRNFPGRVHPKLDLGFLASPPMVVAYALKGNIQGDIQTDSLGQTREGEDVFLQDIWPSKEEISEVMYTAFQPSDVKNEFVKALNSEVWRTIECPDTSLFPWDNFSRNLRRPKFAKPTASRLGKYEAAPLLVLGDDMTTDHISPAGWIDPNSKAGNWLIERGGDPKNLNVYASYRGNWEVMLRGLFTNKLAKNYLSDDLEPSYTVLESGEHLPVFEAAAMLDESNLSSVILAGERYGMGSSRDWAAKGVALLGCRAVIARSFERIHRTNLIGMGILPIEICDAFVPCNAAIQPSDRFEISVTSDAISARMAVNVVWKKNDGKEVTINCRLAVETASEVDLLREGGVLPAILQNVLGEKYLTESH